MLFRTVPSFFYRRSLVFAQIKNIKTKTTANNVQTPRGIYRYVKWYTLPALFTVSFFIFDQVRTYKLKQIALQIQNTDDIGIYYKPIRFEIWLYQVLPLRLVSRAWGKINQIELPEFLREPLLGLYARAFRCNLQEAQEHDLKKYRNLQEFFCRELKPGLRPVEGDGIMSLVSPSDGEVLHFGRVINGKMEQVKGVTYGIDEFLGPLTWLNDNEDDPFSEGTIKSDNYMISLNKNPTKRRHLYQKALLYNKDGETDLYHCIIYLAPGDYHRYHSPSCWKVHFRRHFSGRLYSVSPSFATWFPKLFSVNERVAYIGEWAHGFFSMVPVGATNVGSMTMYFDPELITNVSRIKTNFAYKDKIFPLHEASFKPGDPFGQFNLGSTIVLIFEAPKNFKFTIERGSKLKYGQTIGSVESD